MHVVSVKVFCDLHTLQGGVVSVSFQANMPNICRLQLLKCVIYDSKSGLLGFACTRFLTILRRNFGMGKS